MRAELVELITVDRRLNSVERVRLTDENQLLRWGPISGVYGNRTRHSRIASATRLLGIIPLGGVLSRPSRLGELPWKAVTTKVDVHWRPQRGSNSPIAVDSRASSPDDHETMRTFHPLAGVDRLSHRLATVLETVGVGPT